MSNSALGHDLVKLYHPSGILPPEHDLIDAHGRIVAYAHGNCPCGEVGPIPETVPDWALYPDYDDEEDTI